MVYICFSQFPNFSNLEYQLAQIHKNKKYVEVLDLVMKKRYKLLLWQNVYCANSHKMLFFGLIIIASFHVVGHKICNTLIFLSIIYVIKIFFKQFIPINFLEQKNLYDVPSVLYVDPCRT